MRAGPAAGQSIEAALTQSTVQLYGPSANGLIWPSSNIPDTYWALATGPALPPLEHPTDGNNDCPRPVK